MLSITKTNPPIGGFQQQSNILHKHMKFIIPMEKRDTMGKKRVVPKTLTLLLIGTNT